jgi:hypothetical protein
MKRFVCRLLNGHKWVRLQSSDEEKTYECRRCGELYFPAGDAPHGDMSDFVGKGGTLGGIGSMGDGGGGDGGGG